MDRYDRFCVAVGRSNTLDESLASLSLGSANGANGPASLHKEAVDVFCTDGSYDLSNSGELSIIIMAMRKIREAIIASSRTDAFATSAYTFIIRATILENHMESYHPALLHLLRIFYNSPTLSASEKHEFMGYYILDLACRQDDLAGAFKARNLYRYKDTPVELVLKALAHRNWFVFWRTKPLVNKYQRRLIELGEDAVRKHALKCLGRSYLNINKQCIQQATGKCWKELKEQEGLSWELEGEIVIIKRTMRK